MELTRVTFEAFKSLYDVTCDLEHFTVITGPNGAGKSNLVDALNFVGEVYQDGLEFAVARAGGYDNIAHRRTRRAKRNVTVTVEARVSTQDVQRAQRRLRFSQNDILETADERFLTYRHRFSVGTTSQALLSDFEVKEDILEVFEKERRVLQLKRGDDRKTKVEVHSRRLRERKWLAYMLDPYDDQRFIRFLSDRQLSPIELSIDRSYFGGIFVPVREALAGIRVFQLSPYECRRSGVPTPNAVLTRHGENLPGAANHLQRNDPSAWTQVRAGMRAIIPNLTGIEIAYTEDRRLAVQFKERGVGRSWNSGEVSDGTIQVLALLIALYDKRNPVLVIEEPENSVHPWVLRQFLDLCQASAEKQIVMTTHSPVLLNYVHPASVRLMSMSTGRSRIQRLVDMSTKLRTSVMNGELSTFDLYDSGVLPESVPSGFSQEVTLGDDK